MTKKILLSTMVSALLAGNLMAAGSSSIYFLGDDNVKHIGTDGNKTVHAERLISASVDINASDTNATDANGVLNGSLFTYKPDIPMGKGNLIVVTVHNGAVHQLAGNELFLLDINGTVDASGLNENNNSRPVVARMIEKTTDSAGNYKSMTFKFDKAVTSGEYLALANNLIDGNNTDQTDDNATGTSNLALLIPQGLSCGTNVSLQVTEAKDQSNTNLTTALTPKSAAVGINKGLKVDCGIISCDIALPDEKSFGSMATTADCVTCSETNNEAILTCDADLNVTLSTATKALTLTSIDPKITGDFTSVTGVEDISASPKVAFTKTSTSATASIPATNTISHNVRFTVDGTTVIQPRSFDLNVKANQSINVDTVSKWLTFKESGTELKIAYMNATSAYRTFVRVTSTKAATVQAVISTEDGVQSSRFDTGYTIDANGAVIVEAAELMSKAQAAGFTGTGNRFSTTLYVKTTGAVDAVAYQTAGASGSQRYLPVNGATGGAK